MTEQKRTVNAALLDSLIDFYDIMVALDYQSEALDYLFDNEPGEQNIPDWSRLTVACDFLRAGRDELTSLQADDSTQPRYVVVGPAASDDSPTGQAWHIQDTATGHGVIVNTRCWYATEAEAQAAADKLNGGA